MQDFMYIFRRLFRLQVHFENVKFIEPQRRTVTLTNTGQVLNVVFNCLSQAYFLSGYTHISTFLLLRKLTCSKQSHFERFMSIILSFVARDGCCVWSGLSSSLQQNISYKQFK